jgi:hypothetical protein
LEGAENLDPLDPKILDNVIQQKFPGSQKDADIAAHVVASIVKDNKSKISDAIEEFKNMPLKKKYEKFLNTEVGNIDWNNLSPIGESIAGKVNKYLEDRDFIIGDGPSDFNLDYKKVNQIGIYAITDFFNYFNPQIVV